MAVRTSMANLINLVRGLITDPDDGSETTFSDGEIQMGLDEYREYIPSQELTPYPLQDGTVYSWQAPLKYWENDFTLSDSAGTALMPDTSDPINGFFVFTEQYDSVTISGKTYDVYATASDMLTLWAGRIEQDITKFSADGSSYEFAGQRESKLYLAKTYAERSRRFGGIKTIGMVRNDFVA